MNPYTTVIAAIWIVFLGWLFLPRLLNREQPQRSSNRYVWKVFIIAVPAIVIFTQLGRMYPGFLTSRFVPGTGTMGIIAIFLTMFGLGFSAWSRHRLGKNWSSLVQIRQGHQLVTTGPYSIVRNPMYAGILLAFTGAAIAVGEVLVIPAFIIAFFSVWLKIRAEEEILRDTFGDEYDAYRRRVSALIPGIL